jgi:hypothetical protein
MTAAMIIAYSIVAQRFMYPFFNIHAFLFVNVLIEAELVVRFILALEPLRTELSHSIEAAVFYSALTVPLIQLFPSCDDTPTDSPRADAIVHHWLTVFISAFLAAVLHVVIDATRYEDAAVAMGLR